MARRGTNAHVYIAACRQTDMDRPRLLFHNLFRTHVYNVTMASDSDVRRTRNFWMLISKLGTRLACECSAAFNIILSRIRWPDGTNQPYNATLYALFA